MARSDSQQESIALQSKSVAEKPETRARREKDLREVCAAKGFDIAYQPQVNLRTERVTTFEALIRWHDPNRGDISPAQFTVLAEEIGLIGEIGQWVLERACRDAMNWPDEVCLAVNVSALQVAYNTFPAVVGAALAASGLPPSRLELEVTETRVMPDDPVTLAVLRTIRDSGVGIVMDDFDIGYSALGYLLNFPFSKIKIDRSFTDKLPRDEHRHEAAITIVRSIIGLCKELKITCLAEGVETQEQLSTLMQANCTEIQGYLLGRPEPLADTYATIRRIPALLRQMNITSANVMGDLQQPQSQGIPFLQIAETANDIILVTTPDLDPPGPLITYVNPAFTRLTGYTAAEAVGLSPRMLQGPGSSRATLDKILASLLAGRPPPARMSRPVETLGLYRSRPGSPPSCSHGVLDSPCRSPAGRLVHLPSSLHERCARLGQNALIQGDPALSQIGRYLGQPRRPRDRQVRDLVKIVEQVSRQGHDTIFKVSPELAIGDGRIDGRDPLMYAAQGLGQFLLGAQLLTSR